jgi:hypothetical protein
MPYNRIRNILQWRTFLNSEAIKVRDARGFIKGLRSIDYSVVESRREGHRMLNDLLSNAPYGEHLVDNQMRFPGANSDFYISLGDTCTSAAFTTLSAALSWRSDPNKVEAPHQQTDNGRANAPRDDTRNSRSLDNETQNNTKRFEEAIKTLSDLLSSEACTWYNEVFENRTGAVWTD